MFFVPQYRMASPNPAYSFLNTIKYTFADDTTTSDAMICMDHDHALLKPQIISTWMPSGVGSKPGKRVLFGETQVRICSRIFIIFKSKNEILLTSETTKCAKPNWSVKYAKCQQYEQQQHQQQQIACQLIIFAVVCFTWLCRCRCR